ncbi:MAG: DUF2281 domain-containing protein [bacterium]|nr:DUF2281 domain-containing protein [bacterium]
MAIMTYNENAAIRQSINKLIDNMPNYKLIEIYDYIRFISSNTSKLNFDEVSCLALSEPSLATDWLTNEEDEFWKDL